MTKKIKWRLSTLPTPEEVTVLFDKGLLTKDEAREILFNIDTYVKDPNGKETRLIMQEELESEIKFLRELVERLCKDKTKIVETVRIIEKPYYTQPWYGPYQVWCSSVLTSAIAVNSLTSAVSGGSIAAAGSFQTANTAGAGGFSSISTF